MNRRGILIVLSGPSGAGKGTVLAKATQLNKDLKISISCTTRSPREGEVDGVDYYFKTREEFLQMVHNNELLEYANVFENLYGTSRRFVEDCLRRGQNVVLEIDVQGALKVKKAMPSAVMVFIVPKDQKILNERLIGRGTETENQLDIRIGKAKEEIAQASHYDYIIINDTVDQCCEDFLNIIKVEKLRVVNNKSIIKSFK